MERGMDWKLNFRDDEILEMKTSGIFSFVDLTKMIEQVIENPKWKPGMNIIADFREIDVKGMNVREVYEAKNLHVQYNDLAGEGKIATILSSNLAYGFSRVYQSITSEYVKSKIMTFRDYDNGLDWINGKLKMDV
jgi:hypothetical protein